MSALSRAEAEGSRLAPDAPPRMGAQQMSATWSRGRDEANRKRKPEHRDDAPRRATPKRDTLRMARITGTKDTFPRFVAFQRNQIRQSLCSGLPHRYLPLSGFLTPSAVCS